MQLTERKIIHENYRSIRTDNDCRRPLFPVVNLAKAFDRAKKVLNAVFAYIPAASDLSAGAATVLSVTIVALVCLLAGLVAHTVIAQRLVNLLESSLLSKIPGYDYLKQESASALGVAEWGASRLAETSGCGN